jgi:hypothetical protein
MSTEQTPATPWHVTVCAHHPITGAQADGLFDAVANAAHDWEGWEPDGPDVDVSGGPCCCRRSPDAVARVVDAAREMARALRLVTAIGGALSKPGDALVAAVDALDADADPATDRDFDQAAAAAAPVTVVGTRPPWQVHAGPPPTHGTPAAALAHGPGWDQETIADLDRLIGTHVDHCNSVPCPARVTLIRIRRALAADWDRLAAELSNAREWLDLRTSELASANSQRDAARAELAEALNDVDDRDAQISTLRDDLNHQTGAAFDNQAEADRLRAELAQVTADRDHNRSSAQVMHRRLQEVIDDRDRLAAEVERLRDHGVLKGAALDAAQADLDAALVTISALRDELAGQRTIPTQPATTGTDATEET